MGLTLSDFCLVLRVVRVLRVQRVLLVSYEVMGLTAFSDKVITSISPKKSTKRHTYNPLDIPLNYQQ
jgi:hypothetical protein